MKLREYIQNLNKLAKEHPEYLDLDVIIISNDEENYYTEVAGDVDIFYYDEESECYLDKNDFDFQFRGEKEFEATAICIN